VGAIKMALAVGQDRFYKYVREFGFGQRTGVELPGETRGLLRPVQKWDPASIGSVAMGQEVGVTPVQLVSMVSTIANGGTYIPPRVLLTNGAQGGAPMKVQPLHVGEELLNPLPNGAHRVISEMAAAEMRKMMEGVVLFGTGKPAQLNGYSSGGKTGTAQKVDPATHKYSKTMHIASFAGIAPVNNPVIAVAVVMDNPKGGSYYGTAVSAPVFADVAQQVLEYLGVPHDIDVKPAQAVKRAAPVAEDGGSAEDVNALFAAVNDLPEDDPLRAPAPPQSNATNTATPAGASAGPVKALAKTTAAAPQKGAAKSNVPAPPLQKTSAQVTISDGKRLVVPSLVGLPVRKVIETAAAAGLDVEIVGSGTAREQAPAPGTKVSTGTRIVVKCTH
jgi:cell division protein FtsI (penicillin-binding protein 3)